MKSKAVTIARAPEWKPNSLRGMPVSSGMLLQRKCSCGQHTLSGGECKECAAKKNKLQRKLRIGSVNDPLEHEADRVADQVMSRSPLSRTHRIVPSIQRANSSAGDFQGEVPDSVTRTLSSAGRPLDANLREDMSTRFGHDFSDVRIHQGGAAEQTARDVNARAYTVGNNVVFGVGEFEPKSQAGKHLLAHELTHVVQQDQVLRRKGPTAEEARYEIKLPDGIRYMTAAEIETLKQNSIRRLRIDLKLVSDLAQNGRDSQFNMLKEYHGGVEGFSGIWKKPKALIGIAADMKAGVTPPFIGMWAHAQNFAAEGSKALDSGNLVHGANMLSAADRSYHDSMREWNAYREATIGGAENVASNLETVRDVSFAIALAAGAAVAAPLIATAAAGAGIVGTSATIATALGTAGTTGVLGGALGGGSSALGSLANTGKVDTKAALKDAKKFGKQGVVTGLTAGLGTALGASGKVAELAKPLVQQSLKRCLTEAGVNVVGDVTSTTLNSILPDEPNATAEVRNEPQHKIQIPGPARAAITGCISGALGVPVGKIGSDLTRKTTDLAVGAGVSFADAKLAGENNKDAMLAAIQGAVTHLAISNVAHQNGAKGKPSKPGAPEKSDNGTKSEPGHSEPQLKQDQKAETLAVPEVVESGEHLEVPNGSKRLKQTADLLAGDTAPAVMKEDAIAKKPTVDGHEVVVTKNGVAICSPSPCPVIHLKYAKELADSPHLKLINDEIQALRNTNPKLASEKADALVRTLEIQRSNQIRQNEMVSKYGVPKDINDAVDTAFDGVESKAPGKTKGSTAPKDQPLLQDISANIDEILPVGEKNSEITVEERRRRALDLNNRELKDALTNQRTKHANVDARDIERLKIIKEPVSLAGTSASNGNVKSNFGELWSRRFSEISEVKVIHERIVSEMKGKNTRKPGDLKKELNAKLWEEFKNPKTKEGKIVAEAIEKSGMGIVKAPNGEQVLRQLSAEELNSRGYKFSTTEGWTKKGTSP